jgi:hypothetical protein
MLLAGFREFNMSTGARRSSSLTIVWLLAVTNVGSADEIHRWRDEHGKLNVEIRGSGPPVDADAEGHPLLGTTDLTEEEKFSIATSRSRREIERELTILGRELRTIREELDETRSKNFVAYAPSLEDDVENPQFVLDAQRNAFLSAEKFRRERAQDLRRLRREEHDHLEAIHKRWLDLEALRADVEERYGRFPPWWRDRIDCGGCPSLEDTERALAEKKERSASGS